MFRNNRLTEYNLLVTIFFFTVFLLERKYFKLLLHNGSCCLFNEIVLNIYRKCF